MTPWPERTPALPGPDARPRRLLLVDDEDAILSSLKRLFRRDGYVVFTATSGAQALALLAHQPVDVILSDQRMPGMTGTAFLRQARQLYPDSVRMILSGYTDLESIIEVVNEGALYKVLTKPWDDDRLRDHVAQAFAQHDLASDNIRLGQALQAANQALALANQQLQNAVRDESRLRQAMQSAAGASRNALDSLPLAVFGIGEDGQLAYVNRLAVRQWPQWSRALGGELEPSMQHLLDLPVCSAPRADSEGFCTTIDGRAARFWVQPVNASQASLGQLVLVQLQTGGATTALGQPA